jgi:hypothetical protein
MTHPSLLPPKAKSLHLELRSILPTSLLELRHLLVPIHEKYVILVHRFQFLLRLGSVFTQRSVQHNLIRKDIRVLGV